jgi:prevent-host-death family protein
MATVTVSVAQAGRCLSKLVSTAAGGDDVIITRRGEPAARLTAARPSELGPGNGRRASAVLASHLARRQRWSDSAQVEAVIAETRDGWAE